MLHRSAGWLADDDAHGARESAGFFSFFDLSLVNSYLYNYLCACLRTKLYTCESWISELALPKEVLDDGFASFTIVRHFQRKKTTEC